MIKPDTDQDNKADKRATILACLVVVAIVAWILVSWLYICPFIETLTDNAIVHRLLILIPVLPIFIIVGCRLVRFRE